MLTAREAIASEIVLDLLKCNFLYLSNSVFFSIIF